MGQYTFPMLATHLCYSQAKKTHVEATFKLEN